MVFTSGRPPPAFSIESLEQVIGHTTTFHMVDMFSCDNFVASLTKLVSSQPRDSSDTFLLGKVVGNLAQILVRTKGI